VRRSVRLWRRKGGIACLIAAWIVGPAGCQGPTEPPQPPGGGTTLDLDAEAFRATVAPILAQYGCHAAECHGGGIRGTFELSPEDAPNPDFDFAQARWQVDAYDPEASPLLAKPLSEAAGGTAHPWEPFDSTDHEGYVAIREWILSGELR
jgi:hypothetical protein